jgi:uncharacterized protein
MPAALSYPGVYLEEISSGVRTITGVATSITAFLGRATRGPTDDPVMINSYGDFERQFGGLGVDYPMSYAVRDFYLNGGAKAVIVRLFVDLGQPADSKTSISLDGLTLAAKFPGSWGKALRVSIDPEVLQETRLKFGLTVGERLFNLKVSYGSSNETFANVTLKDTARRLDRVLANESQLLKWNGTADPSESLVTTALSDAWTKWQALKTALSAKPQVPADIAAARAAYDVAKLLLDDPVLKAEKALATAIAAKPQVPADITAAQTALTTVSGAQKGTESGPLSDTIYEGQRANKSGIYALEKTDLFNILCIPPDNRSAETSSDVYSAALTYCVERRAILLVDPPANWSANPTTAANTAKTNLDTLNLSGPFARNAALYFPRVIQSDPLRDGQLDTFVPCGIVAGIYARTDTTRGVWKAPAGLDAAMVGIHGVNVPLTDLENGDLNPLGINCLRAFPVNGRVIWGARTLRGADQLADEYKYVPVRRTALFIEESLYRGTQWIVFEPNDEPLWAQVRLNIGAFMNTLFRQGAFQGKTPAEAYFVKCDKETTTQNDINLGIVNIVVGFAPLKPAEFVVIKPQQIAGQVQA